MRDLLTYLGVPGDISGDVSWDLSWDLSGDAYLIQQHASRLEPEATANLPMLTFFEQPCASSC